MEISGLKAVVLRALAPHSISGCLQGKRESHRKPINHPSSLGDASGPTQPYTAPLIPTYSLRSLARVDHQAFASTARKLALARTRREWRAPAFHPERSEGSSAGQRDPSLRSG